MRADTEVLRERGVEMFALIMLGVLSVASVITGLFILIDAGSVVDVLRRNFGNTGGKPFTPRWADVWNIWGLGASLITAGVFGIWHATGPYI